VAQLAVDYVVAMPLEACVARLRNRSKQMTKQREQRARELWVGRRESYAIEVIPDGKDIYNVQLSKQSGMVIQAELDCFLKKQDEGNTLVIGTTRIGMLTKVWVTFITTIVVIYWFTNMGDTVVPVSRWLVSSVVGIVIGLVPLYLAQQMKQTLIGILRNTLRTIESIDSNR